MHLEAVKCLSSVQGTLCSSAVFIIDTCSPVEWQLHIFICVTAQFANRLLTKRL